MFVRVNRNKGAFTDLLASIGAQKFYTPYNGCSKLGFLWKIQTESLMHIHSLFVNCKKTHT